MFLYTFLYINPKLYSHVCVIHKQITIKVLSFQDLYTFLQTKQVSKNLTLSV